MKIRLPSYGRTLSLSGHVISSKCGLWFQPCIGFYAADIGTCGKNVIPKPQHTEMEATWPRSSHPFSAMHSYRKTSAWCECLLYLQKTLGWRCVQHVRDWTREAETRLCWNIFLIHRWVGLQKNQCPFVAEVEELQCSKIQHPVSISGYSCHSTIRHGISFSSRSLLVVWGQCKLLLTFNLERCVTWERPANLLPLL